MNAVVEGIAFEAVRRRERAAVAAPGVGRPTKAFRAPEVGQHVAVAPAGRALRFPALEIERMAAHIDEAVDRRRAAENLAARAGDAPAVEIGLGLAHIAPIVGLHIHRDRQRRRHLDEEGAVRPAIFEHEDARAAVFTEPVGEHAPRRAGADDHVVECLLAHGDRFAPVEAAAASAILTCRGPKISRGNPIFCQEGATSDLIQEGDESPPSADARSCLPITPRNAWAIPAPWVTARPCLSEQIFSGLLGGNGRSRNSRRADFLYELPDRLGVSTLPKSTVCEAEVRKGRFR